MREAPQLVVCTHRPGTIMRVSSTGVSQSRVTKLGMEGKAQEAVY